MANPDPVMETYKRYRDKLDKFVTLDSGSRRSYTSGMVRDAAEGKARFDLLLTKLQPYEAQMLVRWARLLERGAVKYAARNWEQAEGEQEYDDFKQSAFHHFMKWWCDVDDGEDHAAGVFFNITGAEYVKWRNDV